MANDEKTLEPPAPVDEDPDGSKLIAATDGLERAAKLLNPIVALVKDNIDVWIATYDVAIRRSKSSLCPLERPSYNCSYPRKIPTSCPSTKPRSILGAGSPRTAYTKSGST